MGNTKTFFDNDPTFDCKDKHFVLTKNIGEDYKGSYKDILNTFKVDILRDYLLTRVGKIEVNMDNTKKAQKKYSDGYYEYLLCDNSEYNLDSYPDLKGKLATEQVYLVDGVQKFRTFNSVERTLKGASSGVNLGKTEEDAMQKITGQFGRIPQWAPGNIAFADGACYMQSHNETGNNTNVGGSYNARVGFDSSRVTRTAENTRMRNFAVNFYLVAKVLI